MTVEEVIRDRDKLASEVLAAATSDMNRIGLDLDSLQISEISDPNDYIKSLGVPEAERVAREARIARAKANQEANDAEVASNQLIAEKNRELAVRQAELKAETDKASAVSDAAGPLEAAEQQALIVQREQAVAEQQAVLRERQLVAEVNKPADAALYQTRQTAEADKQRVVAEAEAQAAAIKARGDAEAAAIEAKGLAEAKAIEAKAEAMKEFNEAAVQQMVIDKLPEIVREFAAPMSAIDNIQIVSTEGAGAVTKGIVNGIAQLDGVLAPVLGTNLSSLMGGGNKTASVEVSVPSENGQTA
ncbi:flotillin domain-containing protein [Aeromicrobium sp. 179-A 4D2 NHS]|uniref:flotillin domain-containing protein n=1 Tax=Aeromicrobium sp. 179-A 4D2 NHS TaxID=3142375 RepID=UPI0039A07D1B